MIKAKKGIVLLKGSESTVVAEFITVIKSMYKEVYLPMYSEDDARQEIYDCIRLALASEENLPTVMRNVSEGKAERAVKRFKERINDLTNLGEEADES